MVESGFGQGATYNNSDYGLNEQGERIVLGTRRADGTYRKEKKVRAGYVPPDEQVTYMSRGTQWRLEAEKEPVPGFDGGSAPKPAASKAAKKNAARRAKKAAEGNDTVNVSQPAKAAPKQVTSHSIHTTANDGVNEQPENEQEVKEKKIRALRKKLRQCEQLEEKKSSGTSLTPEQQEKLGGMQALRKEVEKLSVA